MNLSMEFTFRLKHTECLAVNCDKTKQHIRTPKADTVLCTCHFNTARGKAHFMALLPTSKMTLSHTKRTKDTLHALQIKLYYMAEFVMSPFNIVAIHRTKECKFTDLWWDGWNVWKKLVVCHGKFITSFKQLVKLNL